MNLVVSFSKPIEPSTKINLVGYLDSSKIIDLLKKNNK